jgi:glutamate N-acetyltransferase/amino-acid N-acetyltransferase
VIGRLLPAAKILNEITALVATLSHGERADSAAAAAIMTTDTVPKTAQRQIQIGAHTVRLGAIAKGSGMIAPRLDSAAAPNSPAATMLAFITTDAAIASPTLQQALESAARVSFDRISVDNHPSCSDTLVCLASGMAASDSPSPREGAGAKAGSAQAALMPPITVDSEAFTAFSAALQDLCEDLATQIVTDGEGATRTFRVTVRGARSVADAEAMAREVVNSPLVKCAIHGRDPNWGRIVTAAGNAGIRFDPRAACLRIGPVEVYRAGVPIPAALDDHRLNDAMSAKRVECDLTVGAGPHSAWMIGCDLSAQYVSINADYTT